MYSAEAMNHFLDPQHPGVLEPADGRGQATNHACGDTVVMTLTVADGAIMAARFSSQSCAGGIASCSVTAQWAHGKSLTAARELTGADVAGLLGGLPDAKLGCAEMAAEALRNAADDAA